MLTATLSEPIQRRPVAVVFDGDDTLWSTEPLYDRARQAAKDVVTGVGFDGELWEAVERQLDIENVRRLGFAASRFPTSCVQAYEVVSREANRSIDPGIADRVRAAASAVFEWDPPLVPGAWETLEYFRSSGARVALLTKGDQEVQAKRIERSGIAHLFEVVWIVPEKTASTFASMTEALNARASDSWSIGNSLRSDILPAIEAGLNALWIEAHVWEHERFDGAFAHERLKTVSTLLDAVRAINVKGL